MLKFSKIFLLVIMFLLGSCCAFFLTAEKQVPIELLEAKQSVEYETEANLGYDCLMAESNGTSSQASIIYENLDIYTADTIVIETVLVNFKDWAVFNESTYSNYFDKLEEVADYFYTVSRGKLEVLFNINICNLNESMSTYISQGMRYYVENQLYETCLANSVPLNQNYGEPQVRFLILSASNYFSDTNSMFWPHAYPTVKFMVMNSSTAPAVICHETYHTLGLLDLYIGNNNIAWYESITQSYFKPVSATDIMASGYNLITPTSAYNRYLLSWLDETAIKTISNSNTYIINEAMQTSGTIAYKFGVNGKEFFMIESRKVDSRNYLIVQRINTNYNQNINAEDHSTCFIYSFPTSSNSLYLGEGDSLGFASNDLYYANGTETNFAIGNIVDLGNNQIQFDFFTNTDNSMQKTLNITSKTTGEPITNAVVKVNGTTAGNIISVKEGDTIEITHNDYKTVKIIASGENINLTSGNIIVEMTGKTETTGDIFQIDFFDNLGNFIMNNNILVYINNILQHFNLGNTISLNEGDKLKIVSETTETYTSTYINGQLIETNGSTTINGDTIQIELNPFVCNYYLNIRNSNNEFINITNLYLFNNLTEEWEAFSKISVVYVNNVKVYALKNAPYYYTQVKVWYTSYNTTTIAVENINVGNSYYNIKLDKNIIQNTGDFIFGIADNIRNWFA